MLIKIKDISDSGLELEVPLSRSLLKDALDGLSADLDRSRAQARLILSRAEDTVILRGAIGGEVTVPCVRCLREVRVALDVPLKMVFTPEDDDAEEPDDDADHGHHDGHQLDLEQPLRESLILAVPMTPLCRAACKGLCAVCGGDRNERDCGCVQKPEDHRLAPLKGLKL